MEPADPPQKHPRAVCVHVMFTLPIFALATAYQWPCEQKAPGTEPVGRQRWRRQLVQQNRNKVIVLAHGEYSTFHVAEYPILLGAKLKDMPSGIGTQQEILAKYG
jgi:hypothetical protein